jgi:hypothetical protein
MNERIKNALENESKIEVAVTSVANDAIEKDNEESRINTTEEEIEGYYLIKTLLREVVGSSRVTQKDTESYFAVLLDNNTRKWICRLQLNTAQKYIYMPDGNKNVTKTPIESIDDIYNYKKNLEEVIKRYL